jgi:uncharacterized repeat protein (TIGR01451 family)
MAKLFSPRRAPAAVSTAVLALIVSPCATSQTVIEIQTFAGGALPVNISGASASLRYPNSVAADGAGNLFFADENHVVLRLDATTGVLTLVAGNGTPGFSGDGGLATSAQLSSPHGVAVDATGNVYIADTANCRIRKVSVSNGAITTVAGNGTCGFGGGSGPATSVQLQSPAGIALDSLGNLYIADSGNNVVRQVSLPNGTIATVAGSGSSGYSGDGGSATLAQLKSPSGVAVDSLGKNLYIADTGNYSVRQVSGGTIATVAGNGTFGYSGDGGSATKAQLSLPWGVAVDSSGNLYIADVDNNRIRMVSSGVITTVVGSSPGYSGDNGPPAASQLSFPTGIALDSSGSLYIADSNNNRIRKVTSPATDSGVITTLAGNGTSGYSGDGGLATSAQLHTPQAVALDAAGILYIADNASIRTVSHATQITNGVIATVAGNGMSGYGGDGGPPTSAQIFEPNGVAVDSLGNLYIADTSNGRVREVSNGTIATVAGNGEPGYNGDNIPATSAELDIPYGIAVDSAGNLYIADRDNNRVRKVANGIITTVAGTGTAGFSGDNGPATSAQVNIPEAVAVDSAGNLYIADMGNQRVRMVSNGVISTVAGNGAYGYSGDGGPATSAQLYNPTGVAVDPYGDLYISDSLNYRIREVVNGVITTVAGNGSAGFSGDGAAPPTSAQLNYPRGVAVDANLFVYIADSNNDRIRVATGSASMCPVTVTPPSFSPGVSGGSLGVTVQTSASCTWAVQSMPAWIGFSGNALRTGAGGVTLTVAANSGGARTTTVSIAGVPVTVNQAGIPSALSVTKTHTGNFKPGQNGATYTVTVSNGASAGPTSGAVTVTDTPPSGLTVTSMAGTGWTCPSPSGGNTCTRSDALAAGASYAAIVVTVNVAANATSPQVNTVSVSGGGSAIASATDSTTINPSPSVVSVSPSAGSGWSQTFTFTLSDPSGAAAINDVYVMVNSVFSSASGCFFEYYRPANTFWLSNDADTAWQGSTAVGSGAAVSNSQCTLSGGGASVSSSGTQLTVSVPVTFQAAFAGAKKVYVYVDDNANFNSGWQTAGAWTIPGGSAPPSVVSVSPSAGSGLSQTFTFNLSDPAGAAAINDVYVLVNGAFNSASGCFFQYYRPANTFWLSNDADTAWQGSTAVGSGAPVSNSQCTLSGAGASVSGTGNQLTVSVPVTFKTAFAGVKKVYAYVDDNANLNSGWQNAGAWTIPGGSAPPSVVSVSPSTGSGLSQTFTFILSDPAGAAAINDVYVLVNSAFNSASGCFFQYYQPANTLWLSNDADTGWQGSTAVGSGAPVSNSQCTLSGAGASVSSSGNQLTVKVPVTFTTAFAGVKKVYAYVDDNASLNSGWQTAGAWTVPPGSAPPSVVSVSPSAGSGLSQTFTFTLSDTAGAAAINDVYVTVNGTFSSASGCFFEYYRPANTLWLSNDADTAWQGSTAVGSGAAVSNSQCTLSGAGASVSSSGNQLTVSVPVTFEAAFAGAKNVYVYVDDNANLNSGWQTAGAWTVP